MDKEQAFARFHQVFDYLKNTGKIHSWVDFAKGIGVSKSYMSDAKADRGGKFSKDFLDRIADAYSDYIDKDWLLTGEGEMAKTVTIEVESDLAGAYKELTLRVLNSKGLVRPHYDAKASAGFMDGISEGKMSAEFRALAIPTLNYDFSIDAKGDSMMPRIEDGDTLLCRISDDRLNPPIGKICVLDTKDGWVVKVIKRVGEDTMTLHSLNSEYHDYDIDLSTILGIAEVVGSVRSF